MPERYLSTPNYKQNEGKRAKLTGFLDRSLGEAKELILAQSWAPLVVLARTTIVSLMERIDKGQLKVYTQDAGIYTFGQPTVSADVPGCNGQLKAEIRVINNAFWIRMLVLCDLGFSEAYMAQDIEVDSLENVFKLFILNRTNLTELDTSASRIFSGLQYLMNSRFVNSISNSISNISAHYDISNEMFETFLSKDMTYSCAIFGPEEGGLEGDTRPMPINLALNRQESTSSVSSMSTAVSQAEHQPHDLIDNMPSITSRIQAMDLNDQLEMAQYRKLYSIIDRARLRKDHRVLEIGSGWGSFAIAAVKASGCFVDTLTLSVEQQRLAQDRIAKAGLTDRITVHLLDYRNLPPEWQGRFNRVVSIEMIEAVGLEYMDLYFKTVEFALRKDDGLGVFQVITMPENRFDRYRYEIDFIRKYIFPGGILPSVTFLIDAINKGSKGLLLLESICNIGPHYARTLREWRNRFVNKFDSRIVPALKTAYPELKTAHDIEIFRRKWLYYFDYCAAGFAMRVLGDHIFVVTREPFRMADPALPSPMETRTVRDRPISGLPGLGSKEGELPRLDPSCTSKLIIVSNRLPITIKRDAQGQYDFAMSSGGLVSALSGCKKQMNFTWIGWPGLAVPEDERPQLGKRLEQEFQCSPVYISDEVADRHYNGFSNSILWPLFHYHKDEMCFNELDWLAYCEANLKFAEAVFEVCEPGDIVWVQDYHLMLLPKMLRTLLDGRRVQLEPMPTEGELKAFRLGKSRSPSSGGGSAPFARRNSRRRAVSLSQTPMRRHDESISPPVHQRKVNVTIGFFLHTPFPSSEIFRILPVRRDILLGILTCDLIGFHTYDYARHFLSSCTRILGLPTMPNGVEYDGRYARVGTFPIGIDPTQFTENMKKQSVIDRTAQLERRFKDVKVIVGVDRLDYIKGVPQKLLGLETFLTEHPEWIGKVVLVQVAVPSRQDVEEYQNLRAAVNELVGRINGRFGTVEFMPIHFMHRSITFDELCALYSVGDACLVTSTRDGMNLVSYEYIACQGKRQGTMILSEFAGAAHSLNGSIIVNPWNIEEVANSIHAAMTIDPETRGANYDKLSRYVNKYTSIFWGLSFVSEMQKISQKIKHEAL